MQPMSIGIIGLFAVLLVAIFAWSPLARGLVRESVTRPNEPCTFTGAGQSLEVHRNETPETVADTRTVGASSNFKWVLAGVFLITLVALLALIALVFGPDGERTNSAAGTCEKAFIFGFSALVGLIGGKAIG